jgi:cysteine desulfurase
MAYFDNNATTQIAPEVFAAMEPWLTSEFGNPSSSYLLGREARKAVDNARESVSSLLAAASPGEIVFTSCGTESDNWAILGALRASPGKKQIITTTVEHDAVRKLLLRLEASDACRVTWIEVDEKGELDLAALEAALTEDTALVTTMLANNETGILFPINEIGEIVKAGSDALFHVDGVNAVGKIPIDIRGGSVDLFSISAHKFHGPKGIGALYIRNGVNLPSQLIGGGQELGRRAGTEAIHQIAGIGAAAQIAADLEPMQFVKRLRDRLENEILEKIPNSRLNGTADPAKRLPNTSSISFENSNGEMILHYLDRAGIYVSTGSACNSADHRASHVLEAMNIPYTWAMGSIRFSFGRYNTQSEVEELLALLPEVISKVR